MAFKDRVKEARKNLKLSQRDLAQMLGVSPQLVSFWELGKNSPSEKAMYGLMQALKVDANFLFQDEMADTSRDSVTQLEMGYIFKLRELKRWELDMVTQLIDGFLDNRSDPEPEAEELPFIPMLAKPFGYTRVSAGSGNEIGDEMGEIRIKDSPAARKADFVLQIDGQSMEPKYKDGDFILIKKQDDVEVGEIGVWLVDGNVYIKQRTERSLHSLNPDYPDVPMTEGSDVYCYGKVIGKAEI